MSGRHMYRIRLATLDDVDELIRLRHDFLEEVGSLKAGADGGELCAAMRDYMVRKMPSGHFLAWVAESEGAIVATSGVTIFERPPNGANPSGLEAYLSNMYTLPAWRGRGAGTALVTTIVAHMKATRVRRIWLHATEQGRHVYAKAGFVPGETDMELAW
ncbi:MAG TPA: GNAT family N-acetyltransferase [Pyrinomonadaceae bacterium]